MFSFNIASKNNSYTCSHTILLPATPSTLKLYHQCQKKACTITPQKSTRTFYPCPTELVFLLCSRLRTLSYRCIHCYYPRCFQLYYTVFVAATYVRCEGPQEARLIYPWPVAVTVSECDLWHGTPPCNTTRTALLDRVC